MTPRLQHNGIYLSPILLCLVRSRSGSGWSVFGPLCSAIIKTPWSSSSLVLVVIILLIITTLLLMLRFIVVIILIVDVIVVVTSIRSRGSRGRGSCIRIIRG